MLKPITQWVMNKKYSQLTIYFSSNFLFLLDIPNWKAEERIRQSRVEYEILDLRMCLRGKCFFPSTNFCITVWKDSYLETKYSFPYGELLQITFGDKWYLKLDRLQL